MKKHKGISPAMPRQKTAMRLSPNILESGYIPTPDEIRKAFGPAPTLGGPAQGRQEMIMAADSAMEGSGAYSLISHALEMGQGLGLGGQFMGYPALSSLCQNGLISACIGTVADDMTRNWVDIVRSAGKSSAGKLTIDNEIDIPELKAEMSRFKLQDVFHQAALLTGYFGGCLIFIDTGSSDLETPLNLSELSGELKPGRLKGFTVIEPINVFPGDYNSTNPLSPGYYVPRSWWVMSQRVHASRLIEVTSGLPPVFLRPSYNFFGIPHAQILYDYVLHFQDCRTAGQRLLNKFSLTALKTDMAAVLTGGGAEELDRRGALFTQKASNDGLMMIDKENEDLVKLETPLAGVTDIVKQQLEFVVAINRTPAVKILGISPSGFNATGESDLRNYYDHVESQAKKIIWPGLAKALKILQLNKFGRIDTDLTLEFVPLSEDDELSKANVQKVKADTDAVYLSNGVLSQEEVRGRVAGDPDSGYNDIDPEEVPEMPEDDFGVGGEPGEQDQDTDQAGLSLGETKAQN